MKMNLGQGRSIMVMVNQETGAMFEIWHFPNSDLGEVWAPKFPGSQVMTPPYDSLDQLIRDLELIGYE